MSWQNTQGDTNEQASTRPFSLPTRFTARLHTLSLTLAAAMQGLEDACRHRYASLLIYRLLFMYSLQHAGLLAGNRRYLQARLGGGEQGGFYRDFLRPLFSGQPFPDLGALPLADLFGSRELEDAHPAIEIADEPFVRLLELCDEYLDVQYGTLHGASAWLMAELLGEVCERHEHSRETGTYYTPGVVTDYIVRNTLPLALMRRAHALCPASCTLADLVWQTLVNEPLRFIYPAMLLGYAEPLPGEIAAGLADVTRRASWQQDAPPAYAHPGETWREVLLRRAHVDGILAGTRQERPAPPERLITWNINLPALLRHTLRTCQQAEVLSACYQSLRQVSVLDPTCGTGAFLCAAMPLLQDLYEVCLTRMESWCADYDSTKRLSEAQRKTFEGFLEEAGPLASRARTILQWIIAHNLYGVDLNEEAVEICRLRLYLKLLAASGSLPPALPETFTPHIHVGNSLPGPLAPEEGTEDGTRSTTTRDAARQHAFPWRQFFPAPLAQGGFDVVIGNPPYIEYERVRSLYRVNDYTTLATGNLYALTMERALHLLAPGGRFGMIVPASATCTEGYRTLQQLLLAQQELHVASFSDQRGHLFALSHPRLCIILYTRSARSTHSADPISQPGRVFTTPYLKLGRKTRASLFEQLSYTEITPVRRGGPIPRYGSPLELSIAAKLSRQSGALGAYHQRTGAYPVYFTRKLSWYVQVTPFIPRILDAHGQPRLPSELKHMRFASQLYACMAFAALNSNLFYWLITTSSDGRNLNMREVLSLPLDLASVQPALQLELCQLAHELEEDLLRHSCMKPMVFQKYGRLTIQCLYPAHSRPLLDEIDRVLARHYAFEEQELDFLLHYDGQYRNAAASRLR